MSTSNDSTFVSQKLGKHIHGIPVNGAQGSRVCMWNKHEEAVLNSQRAHNFIAVLRANQVC